MKPKSNDEKIDTHAQLHKHDHKREQQEFQKKYFQFQLARQYVTALTEEKTALDAKLAELSMTISAIQKLKDVEHSKEMWSTLGSDTFVMSDVKDTTTAIVGVGAGVYVKKPVEEAVKTLNGRHAELLEVGKQLAQEISILNMQLTQLEPEIQAMAASMQHEVE